MRGQLALSFRPMKPRTAGSAKDAVSRLYDQVGGVPEVMRILGIGRSQAHAFTDERSPEEISVARALALTSPTATAMAEAFAVPAGGIFTPLLGRATAPAIELTAESVREHGEAIAEALKAMQAGRLSPAQRARLVKEIDEAICALAALRGSFLEEGP